MRQPNSLARTPTPVACDLTRGPFRRCVLSGEAGIGKSGLPAAVLESLVTEPHTRLRCSLQHTTVRFIPFSARWNAPHKRGSTSRMPAGSAKTLVAFLPCQMNAIGPSRSRRSSAFVSAMGGLAAAPVMLSGKTLHDPKRTNRTAAAVQYSGCDVLARAL